MWRWIAVLLCAGVVALAGAIALSGMSSKPYSVTIPVPPAPVVSIPVPPPATGAVDRPSASQPSPSPSMAEVPVSPSPVSRSGPSNRRPMVVAERGTASPVPAPSASSEPVVAPVLPTPAPVPPPVSAPIISAPPPPPARVEADPRIEVPASATESPVAVLRTGSVTSRRRTVRREPSAASTVSGSEAARDALRDIRPR